MSVVCPSVCPFLQRFLVHMLSVVGCHTKIPKYNSVHSVHSDHSYHSYHSDHSDHINHSDHSDHSDNSHQCITTKNTCPLYRKRADIVYMYMILPYLRIDYHLLPKSLMSTLTSTCSCSRIKRLFYD